MIPPLCSSLYDYYSSKLRGFPCDRLSWSAEGAPAIVPPVKVTSMLFCTCLGVDVVHTVERCNRMLFVTLSH